MKAVMYILDEMRKDIPRVVDAKVILRNYADRIEAVVKHYWCDLTNMIPHEEVGNPQKGPIEDILSEMSEDIEKGNVPLWADFGCEIARDYVARIKAAWRIQLAAEKAKAAAEGYAAGKQSVTNCKEERYDI